MAIKINPDAPRSSAKPVFGSAVEVAIIVWVETASCVKAAATVTVAGAEVGEAVAVASAMTGVFVGVLVTVAVTVGVGVKLRQLPSTHNWVPEQH